MGSVRYVLQVHALLAADTLLSECPARRRNHRAAHSRNARPREPRDEPRLCGGTHAWGAFNDQKSKEKLEK